MGDTSASAQTPVLEWHAKLVTGGLENGDGGVLSGSVFEEVESSTDAKKMWEVKKDKDVTFQNPMEFVKLITDKAYGSADKQKPAFGKDDTVGPKKVDALIKVTL